MSATVHTIDWLIVVVPLLVVGWVGYRTQRHVKSIADFMAGGRVAGRYLVAVSDGMAALGLITVVGMLEYYYKSAFSVQFWQGLAIPATLLVTLSGFIIYRYRETRALTLAQFLEARYSRNFRVFAGVLAAVAGILNYGIFPAVAGRFFIYYCGLSEHFRLLGLSVSTFAAAMTVFLGAALVLVLTGGQLTIMAVDCVQGVIAYAMYLLVAGSILSMFSWTQMSSALLNQPHGQSLLNPFDAFGLSDFNIWFVLIGIVGQIYITMAWQGQAGYNAAAINPHEQKMGKVLGTWRGGASAAMVILIAIAAYTYMHHPHFAAQAQVVHAELNQIPNESLRTEVLVPVVMRHVLPPGVMGAFLAVMLLLMLSTDVSYLHSWGSIIVQDVVLPFRKTPFTMKQQILLLRLSITAVAAFALTFSLFVPITDYIFMFFNVTGAIYLGGAGSVIIGGLYWRRGTTSAAWASMLVGAFFGAGGYLMEHLWRILCPWLLQHWPHNQFLLAHQDKWFINGTYMWLISFSSAIVTYIAVSLLTCRQPYNLDRLLHRGPYAKAADGTPLPPVAQQKSSRFKQWKRILLGFDEQFTFGDKLLSSLVFGWSMFLFGLFLLAIVWNAVHRWPDSWWATYFWYTGVVLSFVVGAITSVWFGIGCVVDLRKLFVRLAALERNSADDGRVIGHVNAEDLNAVRPIVRPAPAHAPDEPVVVGATRSTNECGAN